MDASIDDFDNISGYCHAMVDILLELADDVIAVFEKRARLLGTTAEDLLRSVIHDAAKPREFEPDILDEPICDEPIVKAAEIEAEYQRLGCGLGWSFVTCPYERRKTSRLLFVSLNPGGRAYEPPRFSFEKGSAYIVESWLGKPPGSRPLQRQVQQLFAMLELNESQVFSANFIPFRSPTEAELHNGKQAKLYAVQLWHWLLPKVEFERIVCCGKGTTARLLVTMLDAKLEASIPVGWEPQTGDRYRLPDGRSLVALPHLSRFGLFGRPESEAGLRELLEL